MKDTNLVVGETYKNKTWNYLAPCLRFFGKDFMSKFSKIRVYAMGIADGNNLASHKGRCIYLMVDTKYQPKEVELFLEYVSYQDYHVKSYTASKESNGRRHMVVLELPKTLNRTYDAFIQGKYSKMFKGSVEKLFNTGERRAFWKIIKKDVESLGKHVKNINREFNTTLSPSECLHHEYDTPPEVEEEIFNYPETDSLFVASMEEFKTEEV